MMWTQPYYPYGKRQAYPALGQNDQWFAGKYSDDLTQLVDMGARQYSPAFGRFMSIDAAPVSPGKWHSFNRYEYANNNPYRYSDPNGQSPLEIAFLVADTVSLVSALSSGEGVGMAVTNELIDVVGVASPVPGISEAAHGLEAAGKVAHVAEDAERVAKTAADELPNFVVSKGTTPEIAANVEKALAQGKPSVLTRSEDRALIRQNRRDALRGQPAAGEGRSLDEYPFASCVEGGAGACVASVPASEQNIQGGQLSSFYQKYGIKDGDQFKVTVGE
jgi:RHS repeat-associated protein